MDGRAADSNGHQEETLAVRDTRAALHQLNVELVRIANERQLVREGMSIYRFGESCDQLTDFAGAMQYQGPATPASTNPFPTGNGAGVVQGPVYDQATQTALAALYEQQCQALAAFDAANMEINNNNEVVSYSSNFPSRRTVSSAKYVRYNG